MPNATLTNRALKNTESGIDVTIPSSKIVPGLFTSSIQYHVVVVSDLNCFKSAKHSDDDVVQFSISKEIEDFENLKKSFSTSYPGTVFPSLPRRSITTVINQMQANEWSKVLEKFLNFLANEPQFALRPYMLEFLGVNPAVSKTVSLKHRSIQSNGADIFEKDTRKEYFIPESSSKGLFEVEDEDETLGLFEDINKDLSANNNPKKVSNKDRHNLFDHDSEVFASRGSSDLLFTSQDYDGDDDKNKNELFLVPGATKERFKPDVKHEDNSDLLNIDDDLEEILRLNKPALETDEELFGSSSKKSSSHPEKNIAPKPTLAPKPKIHSSKPEILKKPNIATKPERPNVPSKPRQLVELTKQSDQTNNNTASQVKLVTSDDVDSSDILQYIQDNIDINEDNVDLFS